MAIKCVLLVLCYHLLLGGAVSEFTPTVYPAKTHSSSQCDQSNPLYDQQLIEVLKEIQKQLPSRPATSCMDIHNADPSAPSGYYSIRAANGSAVQVYCDMEGTNCGGEGGWTRVAYVNMSQPGATCPQGLNKRNFTEGILCGSIRNGLGCNGTYFLTPVEYSQVCGQVVGYQFYSTTAFQSYIASRSLTIDDAYVDGVSITYGSTPRKHIWTYAGGLNEIYTGSSSWSCPCNQHQQAPAAAPPYINSDYYCESGNEICCFSGDFSKYFNDILWDGQLCRAKEAPCCTHPNMPWFFKTLNETTTEDIELRVCGGHLFPPPYPTQDTPLEIIELFIR